MRLGYKQPDCVRYRWPKCQISASIRSGMVIWSARFGSSWWLHVQCWWNHVNALNLLLVRRVTLVNHWVYFYLIEIGSESCCCHHDQNVGNVVVCCGLNKNSLWAKTFGATTTIPDPGFIQPGAACSLRTSWCRRGCQVHWQHWEMLGTAWPATFFGNFAMPKWSYCPIFVSAEIRMFFCFRKLGLFLCLPEIRTFDKSTCLWDAISSRLTHNELILLTRNGLPKEVLLII